MTMMITIITMDVTPAKTQPAIRTATIHKQSGSQLDNRAGSNRNIHKENENTWLEPVGSDRSKCIKCRQF